MTLNSLANNNSRPLAASNTGVSPSVGQPVQRLVESFEQADSGQGTHVAGLVSYREAGAAWQAAAAKPEETPAKIDTGVTDHPVLKIKDGEGPQVAGSLFADVDGLDAEPGWDGRSPIIVIIGSGPIDFSHPDLKGREWVG